MTFKPSDNEERYFARLELERRLIEEQRRRHGADRRGPRPGATTRQPGETCGQSTGSHG